MDQIIKIYNPLENKFGRLSNNAKHIMDINGEDWKSVDHYVFSNLLKNPIYRLKIKNTPTLEDSLKSFKTEKLFFEIGEGPKGPRPIQSKQISLQEQYSKLYNQTVNDTLWESYTNAYIKKFEQSPELSEILLSTGDSKLLFRNNIIIGVDEYGNGENIVGKVLENIRYRFKNNADKALKEQIQRDRDAFIYKIYASGSILKNLLYKGEDIDNYKNMTYDDILNLDEKNNIIDEKRFFASLYSKNIPIFVKDLIKQVVKNGALKPYSDFVNDVIGLVKKYELRNYKNMLFKQKLVSILQIYIKYLIDTNYDIPDHKYDIQISKILSKMTDNDKQNYSYELYEFYKANLLPEDVSTLIDEEIESYRLGLSQKDIEDAEQFVLEIIDDPPVETKSYWNSSDYFYNPKTKKMEERSSIKLTSFEVTELDRIKERLKNFETENPNMKKAADLSEIVNGPGGMTGYIERSKRKIEEIRFRIEKINEAKKISIEKNDEEKIKEANNKKGQLNSELIDSKNNIFLNIPASEIETRTKKIKKEIDELTTTADNEKQIDLHRYIKLTRDEDVPIIVNRHVSRLITEEMVRNNFDEEWNRFIKENKNKKIKSRKHKRPDTTQPVSKSQRKLPGKIGDIIVKDSLSIENEELKGQLIEDILSPDVFGMIEINNLIYPTITHYIIMLLYLNTLLGVKTHEQAYKMILVNADLQAVEPEHFKNLEILSTDFGQFSYIDKYDFMKFNTLVAMNKKFADKDMQLLLLETDDKALVYDVNDSGEGLNFVGKYLEKLREEIRKNPPTREIDIDQLIELINSYPFATVWVQEHISCVCNLLNIISTRFSPGINLTSEKINIILYTFDDIKQSTKFVKKSDPDIFTEMIQKCLGFEHTNLPVIDTIRHYILEKLFLIVNRPDIKNIEDLEVFFNKPAILNNCDSILDSEMDDCIVKSISNILRRLNILNHRLGLSDEFNAAESLKIAASIIIGKNIQNNAYIFDISENDKFNIITSITIQLPEQEELIDEFISIFMGMVNVIRNYPVKKEYKIKRLNIYSL